MAVTDMCPSCSLTQDLDMSRGFFTQFANTNTDTGKLNGELCRNSRMINLNNTESGCDQ